MIRRTRLDLEPLEGRSLLSGLAYSLTTNQASYQPGQPVEMTFRETNVSSQPVTVQDGPSIDGFTVSRDGAVVWRSNAGINPLFIRLETLQPGQSLTLAATWDGIPTGGSAPISGTFVISNQLGPQAATTVTISGSTAPSPAPKGQAPPTPDPPGVNPPATSSLALSVKTDHPTYRSGHPVRIMMTLHNVGHSPVELAPNSDADGFTVLRGSTEIWHWARPVTRRLKPGHSLKLTAVWDGRPGQADMTLAPGMYTIEAVEGGESGSTTVRIIA
jgi:Intracellular proteinase inhibitor